MTDPTRWAIATVGDGCARGGIGSKMIGLRLAALWLGLIAPASVPEARGPGGEVIVDVLEVLDEADDSAYASGELRRGARVSVVSARRGDWLTIAPPPDAFDWAEAGSLRDRGDGSAEVVADRASVRSGCPEARMPGPPRPALPRGAVVKLLDRPPLTLGQGAKARTWRAIAPGEDAVRYVRADGVRLDPVLSGASPPVPDDLTRASMAGEIPPGIAAELASVDSLRRSIKSSPVEQWDLEPARRRYEALLRGLDNTQGAAVRLRLDHVAREAELAKAARHFDDLVRASRRRDAEVAQIAGTLADAQTGTERGYDARGLLQASSRRVSGQKVHALIGPEGLPIAYLAIPPGIPVSALLSRKVGVRGVVHYDETLGARLITVRDLDPLDKRR